MSNTSSIRSISQLADAIRALNEPLRALIADLDPRNVPASWAPDVLAAFAEVERTAASGRLLMTARAAEAKSWQRQVLTSPADWLAAQLGTTTGRVRADLETSERLGDLDATADAVRDGRLSPEKAGAVADASAINPAAEQDLLDRAQKDSLRRTREEAERRKAEVRSEQDKIEREERVRAERDVRFWYGNGKGHLAADGPIADIQQLEQRIQRDVDRAFREKQKLAASERGTRGNYAFDALTSLGNAEGPGKRSRPAPTRMMLMRVDLAALQRGHLQEGELCEIGGIAVSVDEMRRLVGDSVLELILTNGEAVIDVVNLSRRPTLAQKIAKLFGDARCCVEGCDRAARLEFDHRKDWAMDQVTALSNLDLYCDHHHDLKTLHGWKLIDGTGRRPMVPPTDPRHPDEAEHQARLNGQSTLFDTG